MHGAIVCGAAKIDKKNVIRLNKGAARNRFLLSLAGDIFAVVHENLRQTIILLSSFILS